MKKELLFAAVAAAALASCSGDDTLDANKSVYPISFRASVDKQTRASEVNAGNMNSFNVTAVGNGKTYFSNLTATAPSTDNSGNSWSTDKIYYWPSYQLTFYAWSHAADGATVSVNHSGQTVTGFSPSQTVGSQKDFVVSYNTGTKENNNGGGVTMNFKHALSQIAVEAKCSNDNMKIEVLGVKLVNMATKADFTFPQAETSTGYTLAQGLWTNLSGKDDHSKAYMVKGTEPVTLTSGAQSIMFSEGSFMLIPQQLTKWNAAAATAGTTSTGAYLAVLCRVSSLNGTEETLLYPQPTESDTKEDKYAFTAVGIDTNWEPGKKYTYTLDFCNGVDGGCGQIAPDLGSPTSSTDSNIDTAPVDGKSAGYTILGPIVLRASVDSWTPSSVDANM